MHKKKTIHNASKNYARIIVLDRHKPLDCFLEVSEELWNRWELTKTAQKHAVTDLFRERERLY